MIPYMIISYLYSVHRYEHIHLFYRSYPSPVFNEWLYDTLTPVFNEWLYDTLTPVFNEWLYDTLTPVFNEWLYDTLTFWSSTNLAAAFWNSGFAFLQCPHPAKKIK